MYQEKFRLDGKIAIITGASRGIAGVTQDESAFQRMAGGARARNGAQTGSTKTRWTVGNVAAGSTAARSGTGSAGRLSASPSWS